MPGNIDGGAQIQQIVSIEVLQPFFESPLVNIKFTLVLNGQPCNLVCVHTCAMNDDIFFMLLSAGLFLNAEDIDINISSII